MNVTSYNWNKIMNYKKIAQNFATVRDMASPTPHSEPSETSK